MPQRFKNDQKQILPRKLASMNSAHACVYQRDAIIIHRVYRRSSLARVGLPYPSANLRVRWFHAVETFHCAISVFWSKFYLHCKSSCSPVREYGAAAKAMQLHPVNSELSLSSCRCIQFFIVVSCYTSRIRLAGRVFPRVANLNFEFLL